MIKSMWRGLLDLIWPLRTHCLLCEGRLAEPTEPPVCSACWRVMCNSSAAGRCQRCTRPFLCVTGLCADCASGRFHGQVYALGLHYGPLREAIHHVKFNARSELGIPLGRLLGRLLPSSFDLIVPVPLHPARLHERGYNQAGLIARGIAAVTGLPVDDQGLVRVKTTGRQAKLDRPGRLSNLQGAFGLARGVEAPLWVGQHVLLVDDVLTTGATITAAAAALYGSGAAVVSHAVLAVSTTPVSENR